MLRNPLELQLEQIYSFYETISQIANQSSLLISGLCKIIGIQYLAYVKNILNPDTYKTRKIFFIARLIENLTNLSKDNACTSIGLDVSVVGFILQDVLFLGSRLQILLPDIPAKNAFIRTLEYYHSQHEVSSILGQSASSFFSPANRHPIDTTDNNYQDAIHLSKINDCLAILGEAYDSIAANTAFEGLAEAYRNWTSFLSHTNRLEMALTNTKEALRVLNKINPVKYSTHKNYLILYHMCLLNDMGVKNHALENNLLSIKLFLEAFSFDLSFDYPGTNKYRTLILKNLIVARLSFAIELFLGGATRPCLQEIQLLLELNKNIPQVFHENSDACIVAVALHYQGVAFRIQNDYQSAFTSFSDSIQLFHQLTHHKEFFEKHFAHYEYSKHMLEEIIKIFLKNAFARNMQLSLRTDLLSTLNVRSDGYLKCIISRAIIAISIKNAEELLTAEKLDNAEVDLFQSLTLWNDYVKPCASQEDVDVLLAIYSSRIDVAYTEYKKIEDIEENIPRQISVLQKTIQRLNDIPDTLKTATDYTYINSFQAKIQEHHAKGGKLLDDAIQNYYESNQSTINMDLDLTDNDLINGARTKIHETLQQFQQHPIEPQISECHQAISDYLTTFDCMQSSSNQALVDLLRYFTIFKNSFSHIISEQHEIDLTTVSTSSASSVASHSPRL